MSRKFVPDVGDLCYANCTRFSEVPMPTMNDGNLAIKTIKEKDRSWQGTIFRMLGSDMQYAVLKIEYSNSYTSPGQKAFLSFDDYDFSPVGPDVVKALNIPFEEPSKS